MTSCRRELGGLDPKTTWVVDRVMIGSGGRRAAPEGGIANSASAKVPSGRLAPRRPGTPTKGGIKRRRTSRNCRRHGGSRYLVTRSRAGLVFRGSPGYALRSAVPCRAAPADLVGHRTTIVTQKVYRHQLKPVISTGATAMNTISGNKKTA